MENSKTKNKKFSKQEAITSLVLSLAVLLLLNVVAAFFYLRFDLTAEKRYSLSTSTKTLVNGLKDEVVIKVYLDGELPAGFVRLKDATKDILNEMRAINRADIQFQFQDPLEGKSEAEKKDILDELRKQGLTGTNLTTQGKDASTQRIIVPGAIVHYAGQSFPVQLLENQAGFSPQEILNNSIVQLEYKFANAIKKLSQYRQPRVAFLQGNGELSRFDMADILNTLIAQRYQVQEINIDSTFGIPSRFDAIVIAKPRMAFDEKQKYKIDQYIMRGGNVLWLVDKTTADMDSLKESLTGQFVVDRELNLDDQLFKYGVRINDDLVQDINLSGAIPLVIGNLGNSPQTQLFPWFYSPYLISQNNHAINRNLDPVAAQFASSIDTVKSPGVHKTILLNTTDNSKALRTPTRVNFSLVGERPDPRYFTQKNLPIAVLLEGNFQSVFKNRLAPEFLAVNDSLEDLKFVAEGKAAKQIVIADGDIIRNEKRNDESAYPLGYQPYTRQTLANKDFILNCIEYLTDNAGLLETRNKEVKLRLLDATKVSESKTEIQLINVVLPIVLTILGGLAFGYWRKKRYAK
ncbi:MAG: gliding motility-associated ABC transporter substrate-binding protein GldG [Chitinophagales bacterium]|nr:gliding motility-associated ABC transporter substrate-binding protein GldG [Chitinophagales bacterium]OJV29941.1 MAG: gliding motility-associated ABC transporter substrate-binding protein GldG [Bacteroidetes bacterium 37-13]